MIKDEYDFYTDHDAYERESLLFDRERIALEMAEKKYYQAVISLMLGVVPVFF